MNLYECTLKTSGGGGGGGTGVSLVVTCTSDFAGTTITCTDGTTTLTDTCPSSSPYTIEFQGIEAGTWTVIGVAGGTTYSETISITNFAVDLFSITPIYNTSYSTAYGAANDLVSRGRAALCGTSGHVDGSGSLYNSYYSTSSDIDNLAFGSMNTNYSPGTYTIVANKLTFTNTDDKMTTNFLVNGYAIVSYCPCDPGCTMSYMKTQGNVFNFIPVKAGDVINMPYVTPDNESTFVTFYEAI